MGFPHEAWGVRLLCYFRLPAGGNKLHVSMTLAVPWKEAILVVHQQLQTRPRRPGQLCQEVQLTADTAT